MTKGIGSDRKLEWQLYFAGIVTMLVLSGILIFATRAQASQNNVGDMIDEAVAHAIAERDSIDFSSVSLGELEKHFAEIFSCEKRKVVWLKNVIDHANSHRRTVVEVYINTPGLTLAPEDFIQVDLGMMAYTFFKSGSISYSFPTGMQSKKFVVKNFKRE